MQFKKDQMILSTVSHLENSNGSIRWTFQDSKNSLSKLKQNVKNKPPNYTNYIQFVFQKLPLMLMIEHP